MLSFISCPLNSHSLAVRAVRSGSEVNKLLFPSVLKEVALSRQPPVKESSSKYVSNKDLRWCHVTSQHSEKSCLGKPPYLLSVVLSVIKKVCTCMCKWSYVVCQRKGCKWYFRCSLTGSMLLLCCWNEILMNLFFFSPETSSSFWLTGKASC